MVHTTNTSNGGYSPQATIHAQSVCHIMGLFHIGMEILHAIRVTRLASALLGQI